MQFHVKGVSSVNIGSWAYPEACSVFYYATHPDDCRICLLGWVVLFPHTRDVFEVLARVITRGQILINNDWCRG